MMRRISAFEGPPIQRQGRRRNYYATTLLTLSSKTQRDIRLFFLARIGTIYGIILALVLNKLSCF